MRNLQLKDSNLLKRKMSFKTLKEDLESSRHDIEVQLKKEREILARKQKEAEESFIKLQESAEKQMEAERAWKEEQSRQIEARFEVEANPPFKIQPSTFADKVESQVKENMSDKSTPKNLQKNVFDDVSPLNNESSISGRKVSNSNLLNFSQPDEIEVPLDFGESKKSPKEATEFDGQNDLEDEEQLEKFIAEELALYDPSYYLCDEIYDFTNNIDNYKIYQVIRAINPAIGYLIVGWEMIYENSEPWIRLICFREKTETIENCEQHVIPLSSLRAVMKLISSKDVIPHGSPNKVLRNYNEYIRRFVFSFLVYRRENNRPGEKESIQIKSNTKGVLKKEIHVKLFRKEWSIALQHLGDKTFRLTFYINLNDQDFSHGTSIDLKFDFPSFNSNFTQIELDPILERHPNLPKSLFLPSYELSNESLIKELKSPVKELEAYAKKYYPETLNAFLYGEEQTHLIAQIRIISDSAVAGTHEALIESNKQLWIVRDTPSDSCWTFFCKTLYPLQVTQRKLEQVERTLTIPYSDLWKYFGVDYTSCDRSDIRMFMSMLLDSMKLEMPTITIKKSINTDVDAEEEIHIKLAPIDTICHVRHIVNIENDTIPFTMSLIGNGEVFFGIKAVAFNRNTLTESGVFLKVETDEWRHTDEYISNLPRHSKKDPLKYYYSLGNVLTEKGFEHIFRNLNFNSDKVPFIENAFGDVTKIDVFTKQQADLIPDTN